MAKPISVALLGGGTVGAAVARLLVEQADDFLARVGQPLELTGVAVRDIVKQRSGINPNLIKADANTLAASGADIVIELIGGIEPAKTLIETAIKNGSSVVTANKALLASHGAHLHRLAQEQGVDIFYEAAVAGAIPLIRPLRESLAGDKVRRILGIVNGTTNYILSKMYAEGASYNTALSQAQALGYAEVDPTADVEGFDSAAKAAILAGIAFHTNVTSEDVYREGISKVTAGDFASAKSMGYVIKLLAIADLTDDGKGVIVRVHPSMIPINHPLASVRDAFNAVFVEAEAAGQMMFYGRGAGGDPTASSVLGDVIAVARNRIAGRLAPPQSIYADLELRSIVEAKTSYYINLRVADIPGVLAAISSEFAKQDVSIQTVRQDGIGDDADLVICTHKSTDGKLSATVNALKNLPAVKEVVGVMRVEGGLI